MKRYNIWTTEDEGYLYAESPHVAAATALLTLPKHTEVFVQEVDKEGEPIGVIARFVRLPSTVTSMVEMTGGGWTHHIAVAKPGAI